MDFTVGIVSQNLATMSNFIEFRDNQHFRFFKARRGVQDSWYFVSGSKRCHVSWEERVKHELKCGAHERQMAPCEWVEIQWEEIR